MIEVKIPGIPKATQTGSVITVKGRSFPLRRHTEWSAYCRLMMQAQAPEQPLDGGIDVSIQFILPKPKSTKRPVPWCRPDVENLAKGLLDMGNGILWHDDAQIVRLTLSKDYAKEGEGPGVILTAR